MFYYLYGTLAHREAGIAVIDCGGVGYKLTVSQNTLAELDKNASRTDKAKLFT
nr:Holliday junction branch migration protein RuvA [Clostridia bacterium]